MGEAYDLSCKNCGYSRTIKVGRGMMWRAFIKYDPEDFRCRASKAMREKAAGLQEPVYWMGMLEPYVCKSCGYISSGKSDVISGYYYDDEGEQQFVDLKEPVKCIRCGDEMEPAKLDDNLKCPDCGNSLTVRESILMWD